MHSIQQRRWDYTRGLTLEYTLDGDIHYTHSSGAMLSQGTIEVEDNAVDLTSFKRSYAKMELGPPLEQAGFEVIYPEAKEEKSLLSRIGKFIRG